MEILIDENDRLIREREQGIETLCGEVCQLNEIFKDLSLLVASQDEKINIISENIEKSSDYTEKAKNNINTAKKNQKRCCWWFCCC